MYFFMLAAASFLAGIVINMVLKKSVSLLEQETEMIENTQMGFLKQLKLKYDNYLKAGRTINNIESFARKNIERYRFGGIRLASYEKASRLMSGLCLVFGICGALYDRSHVMEYLLVGFLAMYVVNGLRGLVDLKGRTGRITINIVDYFENRLQAATREAVVEPERNDKIEPPRRKALTDEENKVIKDILHEYFS